MLQENKRDIRKKGHNMGFFMFTALGEGTKGCYSVGYFIRVV